VITFERFGRSAVSTSIAITLKGNFPHHAPDFIWKPLPTTKAEQPPAFEDAGPHIQQNW
jgi:hypothetical protein